MLCYVYVRLGDLCVLLVCVSVFLRVVMLFLFVYVFCSFVNATLKTTRRKQNNKHK